MLPLVSAPARIVAQLALIPLLVYAFARFRSVGSPIAGPIAIALAAYLVVAAASVDQTTSTQTLGLAATWALLFSVMYRVGASPPLRSAVATPVTLALAAWLVIFAVAWLGEKVTWVANGGGFPNLTASNQSLFWLTVNVVPMLALLAAPFAAWIPPWRGRPAAIAILIVAAVVAVPLSGGRAGWLALGAALLTLIALRSGRPRAAIARVPRPLMAGSVAVAVAAAVALLTVNRPLVDTLTSSRLVLWEQAIRIFANDPLTGAGPGTYSWQRLLHLPDYAGSVPAILAHNVYLQTLADGGLLAAAGLALVVGAFVRAVWRGRARLGGPEQVAVAALVGVAVGGLLDDHSSLPAVSALVVTIAAFLLAAARPLAVAEVNRSHRRPVARRAVTFAVVAAPLVALVVAVPFVVRVDLARVVAEEGRAQALDGDWPRAARSFTDAAGLHPENALYHLELGIVAVMEGDTALATGAYERAAGRSPGDPRPYGALAALSEDPERRLALLDEASRRAAGDPQYGVRLARELAAAGAQRDAIAAWGRAIVADPTVLAAAVDDLGAGALDELLAEVGSLVDAVGSDARPDRTELDGNVALLTGRLDADSHPLWRAVAAARAGDLDAAWRLAGEAASAEPYRARSWRAVAEIARLRCDRSAYEQAKTLEFWSPGGAVELNLETVYAAMDVPYRERGLGRYQPVPTPLEERERRWPDAYLPAAPTCPGWTDAP